MVTEPHASLLHTDPFRWFFFGLPNLVTATHTGRGEETQRSHEEPVMSNLSKVLVTINIPEPGSMDGSQLAGK